MKTSPNILGVLLLISCIGYSYPVVSAEKSPPLATDKPDELVVEI